MNTEIDELTTDDEALRESAFTTGKKPASRFNLRPLTALSLSWLQRNRVFDDEFGDMLQKTAAYTFIHSEPKGVVRSVVNNRADFLDAVDDWIDSNVKFHGELEPLAVEMNGALEVYMAASTAAQNPSPQGPTAKN